MDPIEAMILSEMRAAANQFLALAVVDLEGILKDCLDFHLTEIDKNKFYRVLRKHRHVIELAKSLVNGV